MSKNIVFEGWLTKSPPSKRIWKTKWRRRWFALRQSGELPGQYFLDYYADCNCRRFKGTINLDCCEQVDAGLLMERDSNCSVESRLGGSVFTIQTQSRTYHLEAENEAEMRKWVDAICRVCGLRQTDDSSTTVSGVYRSQPAEDNSKGDIPLKKINKNKSNNGSVSNSHYNTLSRNEQYQPIQTNRQSTARANLNNMNDYAESTGPYIPISECITGARPKESTFTYNTQNVVRTKATIERAKKNRHVQWRTPQIRVNNVEWASENDSNLSEEESRSLNPRNNSVSRSFKKLSIVSQGNINICEDASRVPPPVPPRPPKTLALANRELFQVPRIQESWDNASCSTWTAQPRRGATPPSPGRSYHSVMRTTDDEDEACGVHTSHYYNLTPISIPPVVDRALKPRISSCISGHVSSSMGQPGVGFEARKPDVLQYLDLDFPPTTSTSSDNSTIFIHGRSASSEDESAYKTVDFVRTEAFNTTLVDAEIFRSVHA